MILEDANQELGLLRVWSVGRVTPEIVDYMDILLEVFVGNVVKDLPGVILWGCTGNWLGSLTSTTQVPFSNWVVSQPEK